MTVVSNKPLGPSMPLKLIQYLTILQNAIVDTRYAQPGFCDF